MGKLLSMTGYGSAKGSVEGQEITVELKSVNNRYLDCSVRLPRNFLFAEDTVKQAVSAGVSRGKVDVFVSAQASQDSGTVVSVNEELARGYRDAVARIAETLGLESGLNAFSLARFPDVLTVERRELNKDKAAAALSEITAKAVEEFNAMREREGERLRRDMLGKLETIEGLVSVVEERSPQTVKEYRERLEARLRDILADRSLDEQRVITEAAIFADRTAVDEETVRLHSHLSQLRDMLRGDEPVGRKLDFLIQEINRECNTIGSKCSDLTITQDVVNMKAEVEKIREQVQNIE